MTTKSFNEYVKQNIPKSRVWAVSFSGFDESAWFETLTSYWRQRKKGLFARGLCYLGEDGFVHMFYLWGSMMVMHPDGTRHFSFDHSPATLDVLMMSTDTAKNFYALESEYNIDLLINKHFVRIPD